MLRVNRVETSTCVGTHLRVPRHEQHVVEGEGRRDGRCSSARWRSAVRSSVSMWRSHRVRPRCRHAAPAPWHFLYFLPLPHGHGSLRPTFGSSRCTVLTAHRRRRVRGRLRARTGSLRPRPAAAAAAAPTVRAEARCAARRRGSLRMSGAGRRGAGRRTGAGPARRPRDSIDRAQPPQVARRSPRRRAPSWPGTARSSRACTRPADRAGRSRAGRCLPSGGRGCRGDPSTARRRSAA